MHDCGKGKYEGAWSTFHAPSTAILITRRIDSEGVHMNGFLVRVVAPAVAMMLWPISFAGQTNPYKSTEELPPRNKAAHILITEGPALESAYSNWAIIQWTSNNPGGADEHFGVVIYGMDPKNLNAIAKSHIRLNRNHPYTVFRVRVDGLQPRTTYYYTVDSMEGNGTRDGVKSPIKHFTTR